MQTKSEILDLIYENPIEIGHWVGFKDLTDMNNTWLWNILFKEEDQTIQGHRGSYKTTTLSLFLAIHAVIRPNESSLFFRKTGSDVTEVIRQTGNILKSGCMGRIVHILYNKELRLVKDSNFEIQTNLTTSIKGSSQISGLGIGTSITGKHADIVITDDIINVKDRVSTAERERTKLAYMELVNIKNRGGRFINTGTPWHKDDAFTLMPNPDRWDCYTSGLMTPEQVEDVKAHMSPSLFAANYELKHIASEDLIFPEPKQDADVVHVMYGTAHVDSAFYGEDYTAFTIMNYHDGHYYVLGKMWRKHVEDCYQDILRLYNENMCGRLYMERNADKGMVAKELKKLGARSVTYDEHTNKHIKIVTYLKAIWPEVVFVEGSDPEYIAQIMDYTEHADHDDAPDSAACLARILYRKSSRGNYGSIIGA